MHIYKGYQYEPYKADGSGAGQRQEQATSREELERRYAESHSVFGSGAPKPQKQRDLLPFVIVIISTLVAAACVVAWMFDYELVIPLLAMNTVLLGGYVGWRMM